MSGRKTSIARIDAELEEIIPEFFKITKDEIEELREALSTLDYELLRRMGHNIKGACLGYGFEEMSNYGKAIEEAAIGREGMERLRGIIDAYASYVETVKVVYK